MEEAVLGSPALTVLMVSVDVKQHRTIRKTAQELYESGGGRPGLPVPNKPCGLCARKATLNLSHRQFTPVKSGRAGASVVDQ